MSDKIKLHTQGVSDDWSVADGDRTSKLRGLLGEDQVLSALRHVAALDPPVGHDCVSPRAIVELADGPVSFTGRPGALFCDRAGADVTANDAAAYVFGHISLEDLKALSIAVAPPPPAGTAASTADGPAKPSRLYKAAGVLGEIAGTAMSGGAMAGVETAGVAIAESVSGKRAPEHEHGRERPAVGRVRRRFTWRQYVSFVLAGCFLAAGLVSAVGAISVAARGGASDDIAFAAVTSGLLMFIGLVWIYASIRQAPRMDEKGNWIDADGNVILGVGLAHIMNLQDHEPSDDGDYGGD